VGVYVEACDKADVCDLLGCCAASSVICCWHFKTGSQSHLYESRCPQRGLRLRYQRISLGWHIKQHHLVYHRHLPVFFLGTLRPVKMGPTCCPKMSVTNYPKTLHNMPENHWPQIHCSKAWNLAVWMSAMNHCALSQFAKIAIWPHNMDAFSDFLPKLSDTTDRQVSTATNQYSPADPLSSTCGTNHHYLPEFVSSPYS